MSSSKSVWKKLYKSLIKKPDHRRSKPKYDTFNDNELDRLFEELTFPSQKSAFDRINRNNHAITFKSDDLSKNPSQYGGRIIKPAPQGLQYKNLNNYTSSDIRAQNPITIRRNNSNLQPTAKPKSIINTDKPLTMEKAPQYPSKKCLNCMNDFIPFSGDQRMCKICVNDVIMSTSGSNIRNKRTAFHTAFNTAEDYRMDQLRDSPSIFREQDRNRICTTCNDSYKVKSCCNHAKSRICNPCSSSRESKKNSIIASHYTKNPPIPCPKVIHPPTCAYPPLSPSCSSPCFSADPSFGPLSPHCKGKRVHKKCHRKRNSTCQDCIATFMSCNPGDKDVAVFFSAILDDMRTNQLINRAIDAWNNIDENALPSRGHPPHMHEPHRFCQF